MPAYKVDWKNVFDGREHILTEGEHFKTVNSFIKYVYNKAAKRGKKIYPPKVLVDGKSVIIQARSNELILGNSGKLLLRRDALVPEIVNENQIEIRESKDNIVVSEEEHIWMEWFSKLFLGGQKEVEVDKLDELGNRIPIYWIAEDGYKYVTGEYEKEKKIVKFSPSEHVEIELPNELPDSILKKNPTISPKKFAGLFLIAARHVTRNIKNIDVDKLKFDFNKPGFLRIYYGTLAEKRRQQEEEEYQLKLFEKKLSAKTVGMAKLEEWVEKLGYEKNEKGNLVGNLVLVWGRDYYTPQQRLNMTAAIKLIAEQKNIHIETIHPEGKIGDSDKCGILFSLRKSQDGRFQQLVNENETAREVMERHSELGYGKIVEQPYEKKRKEVEEQKRIDNFDYAKRQYLIEVERLENDIKNEENKRIKAAFEGRLAEVKAKFAELEQLQISETERKLLQ